MRTPRWLAGLIGALALLAAACSSAAENAVEAELRAELAGEGLGDDSIDCLVDAALDAGIDLERLDATNPPSPSDPLALSGCLEDVFAEMFAGFADDLPEAFAELESGDVSFDDQSFDLGGFGDDEAMAPLHERCGAGDNGACDDLWLISPIDSPEEAFAESCGGRSDEPLMATCEATLG